MEYPFGFTPLENVIASSRRSQVSAGASPKLRPGYHVQNKLNPFKDTTVGMKGGMVGYRDPNGVPVVTGTTRSKGFDHAAYFWNKR